MKAAVMFQKDELPQYVDFPEPVAKGEDELLVSVKAVAIKHFDKSRASGKHYSSTADLKNATVPGGDGVCVLADGRRVFAMGVSGMLAEKAVIEKSRMVLLPEGLDDITAAALPNAVIGSAMALRFRAGIQPGETVLINGATGFTGRVAVQVAKHYGAGKVIATGRNPESLKALLSLGADTIISTQQDDGQFTEQLKAEHASRPIDVVVDYLWGHSAELILAALKGTGAFTHRTRFVSVGSVTGDKIQLSAANLRSVNLQLSGSGLGSWAQEDVRKLFAEILPEMFRLAADGKLRIETIRVSLKNIETLWNLDVPDGKRLVAVIE
jgi:NADPH:quinone reductase-like Zn-dependent oxidoreductase